MPKNNESGSADQAREGAHPNTLHLEVDFLVPGIGEYTVRVEAVTGFISIE